VLSSLAGRLPLQHALDAGSLVAVRDPHLLLAPLLEVARKEKGSPSERSFVVDPSTHTPFADDGPPACRLETRPPPEVRDATKEAE
jgi:hypothetical protein